MSNIVRKNINMSKEVASWYEEKAKELGISQSALMVIAMNDYIKQDKAINMMSNFESVISKIDLIEKQSSK